MYKFASCTGVTIRIGSVVSCGTHLWWVFLELEQIAGLSLSLFGTQERNDGMPTNGRAGRQESLGLNHRALLA
jgi:hypothetical protein